VLAVSGEVRGQRSDVRFITELPPKKQAKISSNLLLIKEIY